ncbi:MAG: DUF1990 family protein [Pyrinomonadaceae bacterium]
MFFVTKPSPEEIARFISSRRELPFSYPEVGATGREPPAGYTVDHNRIRLGTGEEVYERAIAALKNWKQFDLGWVRMVPSGTPIETGAIVAILTRHFGFWSLNGCRVVYLISEDGAERKFGFAYGTLSSHVERGEERFTIEWHKSDDSVWYDILAFSRPNQVLVKLGFPLARMLQKRFARDSLATMVRVSQPGLHRKG